jgi:hypothetical protein
MAKRQRAPGGGRKKGSTPRQPPMSIRLPADLRDQLQVAANRAKSGKGRKLSSEIIARLRRDIDREKEDQREPTTWALNYLISELTRKTILASPSGQRFDWHNDSFVSDSFRLAVSMLLEQLRPQDSAVKTAFSDADGMIHPLYRDVLASPESWAKVAFLDVWRDLTTQRPQPRAEMKRILDAHYDENADGEWADYTIDLDRVRRTLGFKENKS